jgi:hypothetical protein
MFIRMYNYLKYYNNSSSFNFRNLFFVERSAKFRRIMSNVGSTFRNSKWTDYSLNNVNRLQHSFEPNTLFNFTGFLALLALLVIIALQDFSLLNILSNLPSNILNDHIDSWVYLIELGSTLHIVFIQFVTWYGVQAVVTTTLNLFLNQSPKSSLQNPLTFMSQLTSGYKTDDNSGLGGSSVHTMFDNSSQVTSSNEVSLSLYQVKEDVGLEVRPETTVTSRVIAAREAASQPEAPMLGDDSVNGSFYLTSLSFQKLSNLTTQPELLNLSNNLTTQDQMINTLRWSYRYNNLHRRSMYNSHKLTEVKTLISAGYFDLASTSSNVWFSDQYARNLEFGKKTKMLTSINLLKTNWNRLYSPSFGTTNLTGAFASSRSSTSTDSLSKLSFYEASFHFFLNRVKNFSSLRSTTLSSTPKPQSLPQTSNNPLDSTSSLYKHSLANSLRLLPRGESYFTPHATARPDSLDSNRGVNSGSSSDLTLVKKDVDVLYLKTLEIIYNLTKTNSANPNTLYTYIYLGSTRDSNLSNAKPRLATKVIQTSNILKR